MSKREKIVKVGYKTFEIIDALPRRSMIFALLVSMIRAVISACAYVLIYRVLVESGLESRDMNMITILIALYILYWSVSPIITVGSHSGKINHWYSIFWSG